MVDIKDRKCVTCNVKVPCFNYPNEKQAFYCASCKSENMVDTKLENVSYVIEEDHVSIIQMNQKHYISFHVN